MLNLFKKFLKEERGDVVQYIIVLAVIAIILAFAFPQIKTKMEEAMTKTNANIDGTFTNMGTETTQ